MGREEALAIFGGLKELVEECVKVVFIAIGGICGYVKLTELFIEFRASRLA